MVSTLAKARKVFHTYENKQTIPSIVMAKNLHHSCYPDNIKQSKTVNILKKKYKTTSLLSSSRNLGIKEVKINSPMIKWMICIWTHTEILCKITKIFQMCWPTYDIIVKKPKTRNQICNEGWSSWLHSCERTTKN